MFGKKKNDEDEEESEELEFGDEEETPKPKPSLKKPVQRREEEEEIEEAPIAKPSLKQRQKEITYVVSALPKEDVRVAQLNDGSVANLVTIEEALSELYADIKLIKKALLES